MNTELNIGTNAQPAAIKAREYIEDALVRLCLDYTMTKKKRKQKLP